MSEEIWKHVNGFENYIVSNKGKLVRIRKSDGGLHELSITNLDKDGYVRTSMNKDGKRHYLRLHRIVAETFIPNPNNYPIVNHKDGVKNNNSVENLEWCDYSYNTQHAFDVLGRKGHNGGMNERVKVIKNNQEIIEFESQRECAKYLHISEAAVSQRIIKNKLINGIRIVRVDEGVTTSESTFDQYQKEASNVHWNLSPMEVQGSIDNTQEIV